LARAKQSINEEQAAGFLVDPVRDHVTRASDLIALSTEDTANVAIAAMKIGSVRHLVVADKISKGRKLLSDSSVQGVINMQDVMSVVQRDERLSPASLAKKYPNIRNPVDQLAEEIKNTANKLADNPATAKEDIVKVGTGVFFAAAMLQDVMSVVQRDERLGLTSLAKKYPGIRNLVEAASKLSDNPATAREDTIKVETGVFIAAAIAAALAAFFSQSEWLRDHVDWAHIVSRFSLPAR
jgi:hypothetical protein